jgi:hypothetical protein
VTEHMREDLLRGAVFYDLHNENPYRLDVFAAFSDLALVPKAMSVPDGNGMPDQTAAERFLIADALSPFLTEVSALRAREIATTTLSTAAFLGKDTN